MSSRVVKVLTITAVAFGLVAGAAQAQSLDIGVLKSKPPKNPPPSNPTNPTNPTTPATPSTPTPPVLPTLYAWMNSDILAAWALGYQGQKVTVTMIDDFSSSDRFAGQFTNVTQTQRHGEWTREEVSLIAPQATIVSKDFNTSNTAVSLAKGLNVFNLSYGMYARAGYSSIAWGKEESSIISDAINGSAVVSKAAGNDYNATVVGGTNGSGQVDYLDKALIGAKTAIFVGALDHNGDPNNKAGIAYYSNTAGTNATVQSHFLVVGVDGSKNGNLLGTSFAAPVVTGYAAILGSKFTSANATQITNQLLTTARKDTLVGCSASAWNASCAATYGVGEASLSRALAPSAIH